MIDAASLQFGKLQFEIPLCRWQRWPGVGYSSSERRPRSSRKALGRRKQSVASRVSRWPDGFDPAALLERS